MFITKFKIFALAGNWFRELIFCLEENKAVKISASVFFLLCFAFAVNSPYHAELTLK